LEVMEGYDETEWLPDTPQSLKDQFLDETDPIEGRELDYWYIDKLLDRYNKLVNIELIPE
jgi:hypothetical protein